MAFQLAPRTSSVCSQSPYEYFLPLQGFAPAVSFCKAFEVNSKLPSISGCPNGNSLCTVLSSLSSCEVTVVTQACICIGVTPSTTVSVPKTTASSTSPGKTASQSNPVKSSATTSATPTSSWTSVKSSPSTWATSTTATNTCSASTVTVTVTPSICLPSTTTSAAGSPTPTCQDGAMPVNPPPDGAICQQNGTLSPTNWDLITDGSATSVSGCAAQCLADPGCQVSEYDYATQDCQLFNGGNATELGFVPLAVSPFIDSDVECFVAC